MVQALSGGGMMPKGIDPNKYAEQYAKQKGISVDQAKAELKAKHGDPARQAQGGQGSNSLPPEAVELRAAGIPVEVIQKGDDAIKKYAEENNIQIPEKKVGKSLNFSA